MKMITIWNPWALLVALKEKPYETRHWCTDYRGLIGIHVGKTNNDDVRADFLQPDVRATLGRHGITAFEQLQHWGELICVAELTACIHTESIPRRERVLGNFASGRYAWKLDNVRLLKTPIAVRGAQGLWDWEGEYELIEAPASTPIPKTTQLTLF